VVLTTKGCEMLAYAKRVIELRGAMRVARDGARPVRARAS
jgi:hypothetical protein